MTGGVDMISYLHGTTFDIDLTFTDDTVTAEVYIAEVINVNKYGFVEVLVYNGDKHIKRHISHADDLWFLSRYGIIRGIVQDNDQMKISAPQSFKPAYCIAIDEDGVTKFIARTRDNGILTTDITEAWFTFDRDQCSRLVTKLIVKNARAFRIFNIDNDIQIDMYSEEE